MEIVKVYLINKAPRVYCLGDTNLIPGAAPEAVDAEYLKNPDVKEAIKQGHLEKVAAPDKTIDEMTQKELQAYAAEKTIDLGEAKTKPEILAAIKAAIQAAEAGGQ